MVQGAETGLPVKHPMYAIMDSAFASPTVKVIMRR